MKVGVFTLGCRLNFSESEELLRALEEKSQIISFEKPNLIVVRGCAVTQRAEKETLAAIRRLRKKFPQSIIVAAGCLRDKFACSEANFVLAKKDERKLIKQLTKIVGRQKKDKDSVETVKKNLRTRAFIKIQDGCDNFCTYCIVPYLRNKKVSFSSKKIIQQIKQRVEEGYQEVVLTGVNIGEWQEGNKNFSWLIKNILGQTQINRLRLSSLWPGEINNQLISLFKDRRMGQHLHLSLQSLSSSVLKRMNRGYQPEKIILQLRKLRKLFPNLSLSADLIVGFPGETEKEFQETFKKIKSLDFFKLHVFRYSARPGTAAALMKNQVSDKIKKERSQKLLLLSQQFNRQWRNKFLSQDAEVLFEQAKNNFWHGLSNNYFKIYVKSRNNLANKMLLVKLSSLYHDGIYGRIY
jgi:threonylcarbamoyladenosine tRNA methylthiotransferase MtaB